MSDKGNLGRLNPDTLQETVWYLMTKILGFRGCHEARQLNFGDLELKRDEKGGNYYEWTEKMYKTRQGNTTTRLSTAKYSKLERKLTRIVVRCLFFKNTFHIHLL